MKRKWDESSKETRRKCVEEVITRVEEATGEEIGIIAGEDIIEIILQNLAPDIYNKGLKDAKKLLQERTQDIITEIDLLENNS